MCGVWIALEDVDEDNGPLEYYPGSHRLPYFDLSHLGILGSSQEGHERYSEYEDFVQALIAVQPIGDRDRVDGFSIGFETEDCQPDGTMMAVCEIASIGHHCPHPSQCAWVEENGADDSLLVCECGIHIGE